MSNRPIELILLRQLADRLALPVVLADSSGVLVHANTPAARLFGDPGDGCQEPLLLSDVVKLVDPTDEQGRPIAPDDMPIAVANRDRRPQQRRLWIRRAGSPCHLAVTAFPLDGQGGAPLGAMSIFWEVNDGGAGPGGMRRNGAAGP